MYGNHVKKELSAYCHGELSADGARRVAEHLIGCQRCRAEYEKIKIGIQLAENLPLTSAPASLWKGVERLLDERPSRSAQIQTPRRLTFGVGWPRVAAACVLLLLAASGTWWYLRTGARGASWEVASLEGAPRVGSGRINETGRLAVGEWLETDASSRAVISVANIGSVEVEPNSRLRLVETRFTEHRLALARGRLSARIWAPPRLFFVDTPSAVAVDYGCAYTLEVDDVGGSLLRVTSGWVALELNGRTSKVPAGAVCETRPGTGPGTPLFEDASERFRGALRKFDFEGGGAEALEVVLTEARSRDTLTLWHLLSRINGASRGQVYDRLASLVTPPAGVTRDGVLRLDRQMLDLWQEEIERSWWQAGPNAMRKGWRKLWN